MPHQQKTFSYSNRIGLKSNVSKKSKLLDSSSPTRKGSKTKAISHVTRIPNNDNDDESCGDKFDLHFDPRGSWLIHPDLEFCIRSSYAGSNVRPSNNRNTYGNDESTKNKSHSDTKYDSNENSSTTISSIDSSIVDKNKNDDWYEKLLKAPGLSICFLGTGSGVPCTKRNPSGTILRTEKDGSAYLFDAGEGLQKQMMKSKLHLNSIKKIFSK
jgi:hypothetical protein